MNRQPAFINWAIFGVEAHPPPVSSYLHNIKFDKTEGTSDIVSNMLTYVTCCKNCIFTISNHIEVFLAALTIILTK